MGQNRKESRYTGHQFEEEILQGIECDWDNDNWIHASREEKNEIVKKWLQDHLPYISDWDWNRANPDERKVWILDWVKKNQPENWDPSNPVFFKNPDANHADHRNEALKTNNTIASNLHTSVAEALGLENYDGLKFYSSLHTPVDTLYGVDCFFEFNGITLTVDVTVNQSKVEGGVRMDKADWILTLDDPDNNEEIEAEAKRIAQAIKRKVDMAERRKRLQAA